MTGYLTITDYPDGDIYRLKIPNREIQEIYKQQVLSWFSDKLAADTGRLTALYAAFEAADTGRIEELVSGQLRYTISFYDAYETFYHGFLLALLSGCAGWDVQSNRETGDGRSDIIVEKDDYKLGFVSEIKAVRDERQMEQACDEAMRQIESRNYADMLRKDGIGQIIAYGIVFCGKKCIVRARFLDSVIRS